MALPPHGVAPLLRWGIVMRPRGSAALHDRAALGDPRARVRSPPFAQPVAQEIVQFRDIVNLGHGLIDIVVDPAESRDIVL